MKMNIIKPTCSFSVCHYVSNTQVAQLLQDSATRLQSENLAALAARVTADPMEKVKEMTLCRGWRNMRGEGGWLLVTD